MNKDLERKIFFKMQKDPDEVEAYGDMFSYVRNIEEEDYDYSHKLNAKLRAEVGKAVQRGVNVSEFFSLYRKTLLYDARKSFDCYLLYLEIDRLPEQRFYQPRRRVLKQAVDALQALADDELDEVFISMPPRTGKTSLLMFFMTWLIGRNSEKSNLYSAYSDVITKAFYNGVLEILQDPVTYRWADVFPKAKLVQTNAADETLNIDRKKRYPSLTCRSLYGTLNGACDCNGFLISDDLIGSIEEALNKDRLLSTWSKVDNNFLTRAKESAKVLWVGTRWSMIDPAGIRMELLTNDAQFANRRYKIINLPALNENDESNFAYDYGVGFTSEYYRERRASFERNNDLASWNAQYMGEPIEREGTLFVPEDMRYYNGELPEVEPDRVFMAVDPAFGGGDFVAAPICFQYGEDIYVHDVVYDNGSKDITLPLISHAAQKYGVKTIQVEANKTLASFVEELSRRVKEDGYKVTVTSKPAPNNKAKETRIFEIAPDIRDQMLFREDGKRSKAYSLFMQNVFSFKMFARNKHDDAPDSLCMAIGMTRREDRSVKIFRRTF